MFESMTGPTATGPAPVEPASALLERLAAAPPSARSLAELDAVDLDALDAYDRVAALQLWERHAAWLAGRQQAAIVAVGGRTSPKDSRVADEACEEIAAALRLSARTAGSRLDVARELTGRLAATGAALTAGAVGYWHARAVVEATSLLDDQTTALVERAVLAGGGSDETLARFRRRLDRAVIAAAPAAADQAHTAELARRRVELTPAGHGMAWLNSYLTAPEAIAVMFAVDADARQAKTAGDDRPVDIRRADAFVHRLTHRPHPTTTAPDAGDGARLDTAAAEDAAANSADTAGTVEDDADTADGGPADPLVALRTPTRAVRAAEAHTAGPAGTADGAGPGRCAGPAGGRPVIQVTVDLPTLLGLADHPGELAGYGPIPPALARALAADGDWRRLVTDPLTGHLLDYGRRTYRPPEALARFVRARDVTCRFPGCNCRAERCDLDHACPWEQLGLTCPANIGPLCRRHHRLKTHAGWQLQSHPDGAATFTSPAGHTYQRAAIDHNPEHTARQHEPARQQPRPPDQDDEPANVDGDAAPPVDPAVDAALPVGPDDQHTVDSSTNPDRADDPDPPPF